MQASLSKLVSECESMVAHLQAPVEGLSQLKDTLQLLHHITDMQSFVDELYLPVEKQYAMLRYFDSMHGRWCNVNGMSKPNFYHCESRLK